MDYGLTETVQHQVSQSPGSQNAGLVLHSVPVQLPVPASQQSYGDSAIVSYARVSVLQPGGRGDTSVDTVETEPHVEALMQHVAGRLVVPGASAAAEVKVLMDSGSGTTAISEELVENDANRVNAAVCWACACGDVVGQECVVLRRNRVRSTYRSIHHGDQSDLPCRLSCSLGEAMWFIIGRKTLREKLGINLMAQRKASELKAQGRQDGAWMEFTAFVVGEPNDGAVLRATLAVTAFVPGGDAPSDVDDEVTMTLPSQGPMIFQDSEMEMRDRAGVLETGVDNAIDYGSMPECTKMRDIVFRTHCDVLCRALSADPPARKKPGAVQFH